MSRRQNNDDRGIGEEARRLDDMNYGRTTPNPRPWAANFDTYVDAAGNRQRLHPLTYRDPNLPAQNTSVASQPLSGSSAFANPNTGPASHSEGFQNQGYGGQNQESGRSFTTPQLQVQSLTQPPAQPVPSADRPYGQPVYNETGSVTWPQEWQGFLLSHPALLQTSGQYIGLLLGSSNDPTIYYLTPNQWVLQACRDLRSMGSDEERAAWFQQYLAIQLSPDWARVFQHDLRAMNSEAWIGILTDITNGTAPEQAMGIVDEMGTHVASVAQLPGPSQPLPGGHGGSIARPYEALPQPVKKKRGRKRKVDPENEGDAPDPKKRQGAAKPFVGAIGDHFEWWGKYDDDGPIKPKESLEVYDRRLHRARLNMQIRRRGMAPSIESDHKDPDLRKMDIGKQIQKLTYERNEHARKLVEDPEYRAQWETGQSNRRALNARRRNGAFEQKQKWLKDHGLDQDDQQPEPPNDSDHDELYDRDHITQGPTAYPTARNASEEGADQEDDSEELTREPFRCKRCTKLKTDCTYDIKRFPCDRCVVAGVASECVSFKNATETAAKIRRLKIAEKPTTKVPRGIPERGPYIPSYYLALMQTEGVQAPSAEAAVQPRTRRPGTQILDSSQDPAQRRMSPNRDPQTDNVTTILAQNFRQRLPAPNPEPCDNCKGGWRSQFCGPERPCKACQERGERCTAQGRPYQVIQEPQFQQTRSVGQQFTTPQFTTPQFTTPQFTTPQFTTPQFTQAQPQPQVQQQTPLNTGNSQDLDDILDTIVTGNNTSLQPQDPAHVALPHNVVPEPLITDWHQGLFGDGQGWLLPEDTGVQTMEEALQNQAQQPHNPTTELQNVAGAYAQPREVNQYDPLAEENFDFAEWLNDDRMDFEMDRQFDGWINEYRDELEGRRPISSSGSSDISDMAGFSERTMDSPPDVFDGEEVKPPIWSISNVPAPYTAYDLDPTKRCTELAGFNFWDDVPTSTGTGPGGRLGAYIANLTGNEPSGMAGGRTSQRLLNRMLCGTRYWHGFSDEENRRIVHDPARDCDYALDDTRASCAPCHSDQHGRMRNFQREDRTVESTKHYFCGKCNAKLQAMRAARREGVRGLRIGSCVCVAQLRETWLCNLHRVKVKVEVQERAEAERLRWDQCRERDMCPGCKAEPEGEGPGGAWRCRACFSTVSMP
jgi:hypothetical protein